MIEGLDHVGIAVEKIEDALVLYEKVLGLKLERIKVVEDQKVKLAILYAGETKIELLEPTDPDSPLGKFLQKRGEGVHHIALKVSKIEDAIRTLKDEGVQLIDEKPRIGAEGGKIAFLHPKSTRNVLLELCQK
ncbi:MAG: methylmalonyl-CoA epimerase [Candidatus Bathyarchaeia archaeon]